ncbi:MAG: class B sortase [Lachnospiraceae bacterium]|nr:class B sortase [Lachnospiraceae bacterium]
MKGKMKKAGIGSNIVLLICIVVFCFSAYKLVGYLTEYRKGEQEYSELSSCVTMETEETEDGKTDSGKEHPPAVDFSSLKELNEDVVGWITIPDTVINYPIVQGTDNEYYLGRTFEKRSNYTGAIFLDAENSRDFSSDNSIIYGHNLKTGKMFGSLRFYEDKEYWEDHPYIWIITESASMKYEIFSSYRTDADSSVYTLEFASNEEEETYLKDCVAAGYYETGIVPEAKDFIVTLSTCTSDTEEGRRVVQARKIYEEENSSNE